MLTAQELGNVADTSLPLTAALSLKTSIHHDPMILIHLGMLKIVDKDGNLIPLRPSYTQMRFLKVIRALWDDQEPIRLSILKARQVYMSTIIEALIYSYTSQWANIRSVVIADDDEGSEYLFGMQRIMHKNIMAEYPFVLPGKTKRLTIQRIEWENQRSWVMTDTARNVQAGRKYTFTFVHNSEAAFFPDFDTLMTGLYQSVPKRPRTMIVNESTGNGMSGGFYNAVMDCYRPKGRYNASLGVWEAPTGWRLLFIAWYEHPEYRLKVNGGLVSLDGIHFASDQARNEFLDQEAALREDITAHHQQLIEAKDFVFPYNQMSVEEIVEEQINWRRDKIKDACRGDVRVFDQEYPDSVDTAFLASGRPALNMAVIAKNIILSRWTKPEAIGSFRWTNKWMDEEGKDQLGPKIINGMCKNAGQLAVEFIEDSHGLWKIWKRPVRGYNYRYCMGVDCAEGLEQGDYDAADLVDRWLQWGNGVGFIQTVATFLAHLDTDEFADQIVMCAIFYDNAYLVIEREKYGLSVIKRALQMYSRFYFRRNFRTGFPQSTDEVGWLTLEGTKKDATATLNEWIRTGQFRDPDPDFWTQSRTFVRDERGRLGAQGKREDPSTRVYDDAVMSREIALQGHLWLPACTRIHVPVWGWRRKLHKQSKRGPMAV